ncbi:MAG: hypothetical protein AB8G17_01415 [Gammaproteobacteria bacterium]
MPLLMYIAAGLATATLLVHTIAGSRVVVAPLLASRSLSPASRWLNYYCWHLTTLLIAFVGCGFVWLAAAPMTEDRTSVLIALCCLTTASGLWSIAVARMGRIHPFRFPSTSLFLGTSVVGWAAVWAGT